MSRSATTAATLLAATGLAGVAFADGSIAWRVAFDGNYTDFEPAIGPDGTIYTGNGDLVTAVAPDGSVRWSVAATARQGTIAVGPDGTVYAVGGTSVIALSPQDGSIDWSFDGGGTIVGGPAVAPGGDVIAVSDTEFGGLGMFSLSPAGNLQWSDEGDPPFSDMEGYGHRITITGDRVIVGMVPGVGNPPPTTWAFDLDGSQQYLMGDGCVGQTAVGPTGAIVTGNGLCQQIRAYDPADGGLLVAVDPPSQSPCSGMANVAVGPDGSMYSAFCYRAFWSVDANGSQRWFVDDFGLYFWMDQLGVAPDNSMVLDLGRDPGVHGWVRAFDTADGSLRWQIDLPVEEGSAVRSVTEPVFDAARGRAYFNAIRGVGGPSYLYAIDLGVTCPHDLDGDGSVGTTDFLMLLAAWGTIAADLDDDGTTGVTDLLAMLATWGPCP